MYEVAAQESRDLFGAFLSGSELPLVCVASGAPLEGTARTALENSARQLGYGDACTFVVLECPEGSLDAPALFTLIEGLDPLCLIAADADAARLLSEAYRCPVPQGGATRLFGRPTVAFRSFPAMLRSPDDKQRAWALLKKLPRRDG
ncbi:MAG: hypothetical protein U0L71_06940 [Eggerthellaceae bacterium]|nr:hypothetical protein [Eggerthellaceae bacterium]